MKAQRRDGAEGTYVEVTYPWGLYVGARVKCPDGRLRRVSRISQTADTFFSIPAAVNAKGKTVSGYVTLAEDNNGNWVYTFNPYTYRKNHIVFNKE